MVEEWTREGGREGLYVWEGRREGGGCNKSLNGSANDPLNLWVKRFSPPLAGALPSEVPSLQFEFVFGDIYSCLATFIVSAAAKRRMLSGFESLNSER